VIRLWDLRRLIVPLNYFMQKPFYNWTRSATANIGNVVLYLDYAAPIERIRDKAVELVGQSGAAGRQARQRAGHQRHAQCYRAKDSPDGRQHGRHRRSLR